MKRILSYLMMFTAIYGLSNNETGVTCNQGNQKPLLIPNPQQWLGDMASMIMQQAVDPNELEGPIGVDSVRWVSKNDVLNYTVFFENDPSFATAAAQIVDIRIDMPDKRLLNEFELGTYTFANRAYNVPEESNFYSMRLDVRDPLEIFVDVLAGIEKEKNQAFWRFSTIDPESGHAPWEVDKGLLPVNDSTHIGEGFVNFRIKPYEELVTGDTISFFANILFDSNDTLQTNRWCNKIDAGAPVSKIKSAVDPSDYSHYRMTFEAEDDKGGSGVGKIFVYLVNNLGTYEEYAVCAVDSVLDFYVEPGKQYELMSVAEDRVGNRENIKTKPDLILNFNLPPTDLLLSNNIFQDDIVENGFIAELSTVDTDSDSDAEFTYSLAEGEGAIHNDMFAIVGNRLIANDCFKCSDIQNFNIRLSTTDKGGLSFSKAFQLHLERVLEQPETEILDIEICEGEDYEFFNDHYSTTGTYTIRKPNEFMCDSIYILNLKVNPIPEIPTITVKGKSTLVSSADIGNQWYKDGQIIENATEKEYLATENGYYSVTASNGSCVSMVSDEIYVNLVATSDLKINLTEGWSWISVNTNDSGVKDPNLFFESALNNIKQIIGKNSELTNTGNKLEGNLSTIEPTTYKIKSNSDCEIIINANVLEPEEFPINLKTGWNWIPYIPVVNLNIDDAFDNFTPSENDVIKSHTQFSIYSNGKWNGTLKALAPNKGYLYYSNNPTILHYSPSRAGIKSEDTQNLESFSNFTASPSLYPHNMTIVAKVFRDDKEALEGVYTVAAFCGNECRGTGIYENDLLYITIHGNYGDKINFVAKENSTNEDWEIVETNELSEIHLGNTSEPFKLNIYSETTSIDLDEISNSFNIYPNPVRDTLYISGETDDILGIKIISTDGHILISQNEYVGGIDVTSLENNVYIIAISTQNGVIYKKFIKLL